MNNNIPTYFGGKDFRGTDGLVTPIGEVHFVQNDKLNEKKEFIPSKRNKRIESRKEKKLHQRISKNRDKKNFLGTDFDSVAQVFNTSVHHKFDPVVVSMLGEFLELAKGVRKDVTGATTLVGGGELRLDEIVRTITRSILGESWTMFRDLLNENQDLLKKVCLRVVVIIVLFTLFTQSKISVAKKLGILGFVGTIAWFYSDSELTHEIETFSETLHENTAQSGDFDLSALSGIFTLLITSLLCKQDSAKLNWSSFVLKILKEWKHSKESMVGVVEILKEILQKSCDFIMVNFLGKDKFGLFTELHPKYEKWLQDVTRLVNSKISDRMPRNRETLLKSCNLQMEGLALIEEFIKMRDHSKTNTIRTMCYKLENIQSELEAEGYFTTGTRPEPIVICLCGSSGVGKSMVTKPLLLSVLASVLKGDELDKFRTNYDSAIFARNIENKYWEGYNGQKAVVYDDFGQTLSSNATAENEFIEIIRAGNNFPFHLHYANLALKTGKYFSSDFLMLSTNMMDIEHNARQYVNCAEAVERRFNLWAEVTIKVEYCVQGTELGSIGDRRLDVTKVRGGFDHLIYEFHLRKRNILSRVVETTEVLDFVQFRDRIIALHVNAQQKDSQVERDIFNLVTEVLVERSVDPKGDNIAQGGMLTRVKEMVPDVIVGTERAIDYCNKGFRTANDLIVQIGDYTPEAIRNFYDSGGHEDTFHDCVKSYQDLIYTDVYGFMISLLPAIENKDPTIQNVISGKFIQCLELMLGHSVNIHDDDLHNIKFPIFDSNEVLEKYSMERYREDLTVLLEIRNPFLRIAYSVALLFFRPYSPQSGGNNKLEILTTCLQIQEAVLMESGRHSSVEDTLAREKLFFSACTRGMEERYPWVFFSVKLLKNVGIGLVMYMAISKTYNFFFPVEDVAKPGLLPVPIEVGEVLKGSKGMNVAQANDEILEGLIKKIMTKNTYAVMHGDMLQCFCVFVRDNLMLMPFHTVEILRAKLNNPLVPCYLVNPFTCEIVVTLKMSHFSGIKALGDNIDACLINVPEIRKHADITGCFVDNHVMEGRKQGILCMAQFQENPGGNNTLWRSYMNFRKRQSISYVDQNGKQWITTDSLEYNGMTRSGDCGLPVFLVDASSRNLRIMGIHVAGNQGLGLGFCNVIYQHNLQVNNVAQSGEYIRMKCVGHVSRAPGTNKGSSIRKSPLYGKLQKVMTKPCHLKKFCKDGVEIDPWELAIRKYDRQPPNFSDKTSDIMRMSVRDIFSFNTTLDNVFRVYSFEEVVVGIPGNKAFPPVNRQTSPGFPYNTMPCPGLPGKSRFFGSEGDFKLDDSNPYLQELRRRLEDSLKLLSQGKRMECYYTGALKDERKPIPKVDAGKTRYFAGAPIQYSIMFNEYFQGMKAFCFDTRLQSCMCIGINPYSEDWNTLAVKLLGNSNKMIACDYSFFDSTQSKKVLECLGKELIEIMNLPAEVKLIQAMLWLEVSRSRHLFGTKVMEWSGCLPSGHPATTVINSIYGYFLFRYAWHYLVTENPDTVLTDKDFQSCIVMFDYGDDVVASISDAAIKYFNQVEITKFFDSIGIICTDELKKSDPPPYRSIEDISFLKRKFRFDKVLGRWVAPLSLDTLLELPSWTKKGPAMLQTPIDNSELLLRELTLHGKPVFDLWSRKLIRILYDEYGYIPECTDYTKLLIAITNSDYEASQRKLFGGGTILVGGAPEVLLDEYYLESMPQSSF